MLFLLAFYAPYTILFAAMFVDLKQETYWLHVLVAIFSPLQGFLNFLVYNFRSSSDGRLLRWVAPFCSYGRRNAAETSGSLPSAPERASSYIPSELFESSALQSGVETVDDFGTNDSATGDSEASSEDPEEDAVVEFCKLTGFVG